MCKSGIRSDVEARLIDTIAVFEEDKCFLAEGVKSADAKYKRKFNSPNTSKTMLKELCWKVVKFNTLLQHSQAFLSFFENLLANLHPNNPRVTDVLNST
jgi:hypothetical protein